jgi:restriction endonuclease Mrr
MSSSKVISPAAINSLKEALANIYWTKKDLRSFVFNTLPDKAIVGTIDWSGNVKYESASQLVDRLAAKAMFKENLMALFKEVINFNDFSHLKKWEDAEQKIKKAKDAVTALRTHAKGYFDLLEEQKLAKERRKVANDRITNHTALKSKLEELHKNFLKIATATNPQQRGYDLEKLLNDLFILFDLDPKASFKITGEQIDGAFTFRDDDYLLEAKWQKALVNAGELYKFAGKVNGKRKNTLGLFISIDGFSTESTQTTNPDLRSIILMDGMDLDAVLTDRIKFDELLYRKRRLSTKLCKRGFVTSFY